MDQGGVVESGTYDELLQLDRVYKPIMRRLQAHEQFGALTIYR
jgi:ABC-type multidrug transport system fused ATPase/permease subunit